MEEDKRKEMKKALAKAAFKKKMKKHRNPESADEAAKRHMKTLKNKLEGDWSLDHLNKQFNEDTESGGQDSPVNLVPQDQSSFPKHWKKKKIESGRGRYKSGLRSQTGGHGSVPSKMK